MSMTRIAPRLYVRTAPGGSQQYVYRTTIAGVVVQRGLGSVTGKGRAKVSKSQAMDAAKVIDGQLAAGGASVLAKAGKQQAFAEVWNEHVAVMTERGAWGLDAKGECGTAKQWQAWLKNDLGLLGALRFDHPAMVETVDAALAPVWGTKKGEDIRTAIYATFRRAKVKGIWSGENPVERARVEIMHGPGRDGRGIEKGGDVSHHAMLPYAEVPALVQLLTGGKGMAGQALAFLILTTARSSNVRFCSKACIDRAARTWTIPADGQRGEAMKSGVEHVYYLNDQAMEIVDRLWDLPGDYLFTGKNGVLGATAMDDKLCDPKAKGGLALRGVATVHGFRSSFGTWAKNETRMADVADAQLAHAEGKVRSAYQRGDAVEQMKALSTAWGNYCVGVQNVITLRVAA